MSKSLPSQTLPHLLDSLQEALWLVDAMSLRVQQANAASQAVTGYDPAEISGLSVQVLAATPQQQAFWSDPFNWQAGAQFLTEVRHRDGQLVPVEMRVRALDVSRPTQHAHRVYDACREQDEYAGGVLIVGREGGREWQS